MVPRMNEWIPGEGRAWHAVTVLDMCWRGPYTVLAPAPKAGAHLTGDEIPSRPPRIRKGGRLTLLSSTSLGTPHTHPWDKAF